MQTKPLKLTKTQVKKKQSFKLLIKTVIACIENIMFFLGPAKLYTVPELKMNHNNIPLYLKVNKTKL